MVILRELKPGIVLAETQVVLSQIWDRHFLGIKHVVQPPIGLVASDNVLNPAWWD
jgi:hypothetical protein